MSRHGAATVKNSFGDYEILSVIGFGGMGVVYRAHDPHLNRTVALKVLKDDLRGQPAVQARFQREAKAVAQLNHPNIVHVFSVGVIDDIPYMAMELIESKALSVVIHHERRLPWERALHIAEQLARGLSCAHASQVIHRDIKPANILIGEGDHAYLTDFGIAKILTDETQLTVEGARLGTPDYMSPERCENGPLTPSSDIYSVGVVLFQMLTCRSPFEAASPIELIRKIISEKPPRVRSIVPELPADVDRLVAWMIERKPANRPASAEVLANAIARVLRGEPLDEHGDQTSIALEEFRISVATPTPNPANRGSGATSGRIQRWLSAWRKLPALGRISILGISYAVLVSSLFFGAREWRNSHAPSIEALTQGWLRPGLPARVTNETTGVSLARMRLPDFRPAAIVPLSGSVFAITLESTVNAAGAPEKALVSIDASDMKSSLRIDPRATTGREQSDASWKLVGSDPLRNRALLTYREPGSGDDESNTIIAAYDPKPAVPPTSLGLLSASPGRERFGSIPATRASAIAVSPDGNRIALSLADGPSGNDWFLAERDLRWAERGRLGHSLLSNAGPIESMAYTNDGTRIVYLRRNASGTAELGIASTIEGAVRQPSLANGELSFNVQGIKSDDSIVCVVTRDSDGTNALQFIDLTNSVQLGSISEVADAAWIGVSSELFAAMPDYRGQLQLWLIQASEPENRTQLTFLDGGVSPGVVVSADGQFGAAPVNSAGDATIAVVNLTAIQR
jgi:serine/threonine protein kinase